MTSPRDVVLNAWKTFSSRDPERIAALFTDDAEWIAPKANATAVALDHTDHMVGAHQIARFIAKEMHRLFSSIDITFRGVYVDGDVVIVEERDARHAAGRQAVRERVLLRVRGGGRPDQASAGIHGYAQGMADGLR
ncbi:ketosteroid isomerase-like protein [Bradyrhizobium yuanmingense]|uniref:nuclear transport factor 2 family protein n=1 Tax=Bradyrhizobium yuanmingense TaxID=108015 RepID=UPI0004BAB65B